MDIGVWGFRPGRAPVAEGARQGGLVRDEGVRP